MEDITKIVKSFEDSGLLKKGISKTIKSEPKEKKGAFFSMLLRTLAASILGKPLTGKGVIRAVERVIKAGQNFLIPPHPLTNYEIQKYYENKHKCNDVYSRNNLSKIKDAAHILNLNEFKSIGTQWIALYENGKNGTYFHKFGVEYIPNEIRKFIGKKNIITNIYIIQAYDSVICGYFCIGFIDFMLESKSLLEYENVFSPNEYEKNDKII